MKKILAIAMTLVICLSFAACSSKSDINGEPDKPALTKAAESSSSVSISAFEKRLNETGNWEFDSVERKSGFEFSGKETRYNIAEFNGNADLNKNVYLAVLTYNGIVAEKLNDADELEDLVISFSADPSNVPQNEVMSIQCFLDYTGICAVCSGNSDITIAESINNLTSGTEFEANGWRISAKISGKKCTITAEYNGK